MFNQAKTLIVVYKDEMVVNQLKKLVETNDDVDEETIVGTKDGMVKIVSWNEKVWLSQKKTGTIDSKVLFVGDIKGTDKLIPIIDTKFDKYGIKFGWAGKQAIISVDQKALLKKEDYDSFFNELIDLPVTDFLKENQVKENEPKKIGKFNVSIPDIVSDLFVDTAKVKRQMYFYGVIKTYNEYLNEFMNS